MTIALTVIQSADNAAGDQFATLATAINDEHRAACDAMSSGLAHAIRAGELLIEARAAVPHGSWLPWLHDHFEGSERTAQVYMRLARHGATLEPGPNPQRVADLSLRGALAALAAPQPNPAVSNVEPADADADEDGAPFYTAAQWSALSAEERRRKIVEAARAGTTKFNPTNDHVDWAKWTWNPVTGCLHNCDYCYARDIANHRFVQRFVPSFLPQRLHAPRRTKVPAAYDPNDPTTIGHKNVFVCSMADLFGKWVPQEWIDAVFAEVVASPQWNYLFLTKFPQRLAELEWPENTWCGTTVDYQYRVEIAERSFRGVKAGVKWLSCEPMMERLTFTSLEMFDWVVIGGASKSTQTPEFQPPWEWIEHLLRQARDAGCKVYMKPNLTNRAREYPGTP